MPVTQGSAAITNLAATLTQQLAGGTPARATLGAKEAAFAWTTGLPRGLWDFVSTGLVEGPGVNAILVKPSLTPVGPVLPGAVKPDAITLVPKTFALKKYAGIATFTMEQTHYSDVLPQAIAQTLIAGALAAFEADCIAALDADSGGSQTGDADWTTAILGGIAKVAGAGGTPNVLVISPADFAAAVASPTQLVFSGTDPIPTYLGLALHLSPKATPGKAWVLDGSAVTVGESVASPSAVADPFSRADTNECRVVVDVMAVPAVTSPGLVVELVPAIAPLKTATRK